MTMNPGPRLEEAFRRILATRMAGLPILHPGLQVEAVGFRKIAGPAAVRGVAPAAATGTDIAATDAAPANWLGILVTPWFMNLVLCGEDAPAQAEADAAAGAGATCMLALPAGRFAFLPIHEPLFGTFHACSMASPMFEFETHADAVAVARAILVQLFEPHQADEAPQPALAGLPDAVVPAAQPLHDPSKPLHDPSKPLHDPVPPPPIGKRDFLRGRWRGERAAG